MKQEFKQLMFLNKYLPFSTNIDIQKQRYTPEWTYISSSPLTNPIPSYNTVDINISSDGGTCQDIESYFCDGNLIDDIVYLDKGRYCESCNIYLLPNTIQCHNCLSFFIKEDYIEPRLLNFYLTYTEFQSFSRRSIYDIDFDTCELSLTIPTDQLEYVIGAKESRVLSHNMSLDIDKYLCEFCNSVNHKGDSCRNCGSEKMPMSELIQMDHECGYCGSLVKGNLFCDSCNGNLGALAVRWLNLKI